MKPKVVLGTVAALGALTLGAGVSCGEQVAVSGEEVRYTIVAGGAVEEGTPERFVNAQGWQIELTQARTLVGPIYFYSGDARASLFDGLLGIPEAHACAAHAQFQSGRTLGETTLQFGVDLLGGEVTLVDDAVGEGGEVRSVELHVQDPGQVDPGNAMAQATPETTYAFEGVASKEGVTVPFVAEVTLPEDGTHQIVDSIPAQMELGEGATLRVKVMVDRLFRDVDFGGLTPGEGGEAARIEPGTQAYSSLVFSLRARSAFVWEAK
jgi:hypothetical protein